MVHAVGGITYTVETGEAVAIVGESGCGKSVGAMSILRLIPEPPGRIVKGEVLFEGRDLLKLSNAEIRDVRGRDIAMIFQEPMTSLNPVFSVGRQVTETLLRHTDMKASQANERALELLIQVGISDPQRRLEQFPHHLSGGMRQRVMIAIALSCDPKVLIADEPTTALDVTIQAQILDLVKRLRKELGMAIVWVTHDLGVVASLADRVMVMYSGFIVERADVKQLYAEPKHPYTMALLATLPEVEGERATRLESIEGQPPDQLRAPTSCPFAPRCSYAFDRCSQENPLLQSVSSQHEVACWWDVQENRPRDYN